MLLYRCYGAQSHKLVKRFFQQYYGNINRFANSIYMHLSLLPLCVNAQRLVPNR